MSEPVDLLLLSCNRRRYLEKTLHQLLSDPAEFRLHCWDNGSTDGAADIIASLDDPRVVRKHFNRENVGQQEPSFWFLDTVPGDVCGKIDDDILLPHGWTERIAPMVRSEQALGMIGCWIFMPEDWDEEAASQNIVRVGEFDVFQVTSVAGQSFLARKDLLNAYRRANAQGLPVARGRMSRDGYISGNPARPLLMAHNMDDPRSPHCLMAADHADGTQQAFTMRNQKFATLDEYAAWIAADARRRQTVPIERQLRRLRLNFARRKSVLGKVRWKIEKCLGTI